jgi:hypothetical protein
MMRGKEGHGQGVVMQQVSGNGKSGGQYRDRTCDPYNVNVEEALLREIAILRFSFIFLMKRGYTYCVSMHFIETF